MTTSPPPTLTARPQDRAAVEAALAPILAAVCIEAGLERSALTTPGRSREAVRARIVAIYLARMLTRASYPAIARATLPAGPHSAAIDHFRAFLARRDADAQLRSLHIRAVKRLNTRCTPQGGPC